MTKTTNIICILDRSGSMKSNEVEVINSFNQFIKEQKDIPGKAKVTLVLFDDHYEVVHSAVDLNQMKPLTADVYFARGMTALYDAIGRTVTGLQKKKKAIVLVMTDGYENASNEYSFDDIRALVDKKKSDGWEFVFFGDDLSVAQSGAMMGMAAMSYDGNVRGAYKTFSSSAATYRSS